MKKIAKFGESALSNPFLLVGGLTLATTANGPSPTNASGEFIEGDGVGQIIESKLGK